MHMHMLLQRFRNTDAGCGADISGARGRAMQAVLPMPPPALVALGTSSAALCHLLRQHAHSGVQPLVPAVAAAGGCRSGIGSVVIIQLPPLLGLPLARLLA
jgi:hypothetical protein